MAFLQPSYPVLDLRWPWPEDRAFMLVLVSPGHSKQRQNGFLCLGLICRHRGSEQISAKVPSCPGHRQEGSLPVSSSICFNLWNLLFPVPEPNETLTLPSPCPELSWLLLPPTHRCILTLRVHRNHLGSCQSANSGSGGLRHELSLCVSDKFLGQRPQRIARSQSRESFKDRSMPRA